jgi:hypothetical protein
MPRTRSIKPGICTNDVLAEAPIEARQLFIYMWMFADRRGRLVDRPKRLKGELFPFDNLDIDELLDKLASLKDANEEPAVILRYEAEGERYIQILNFEKNQNCHPDEKDSVIPPPDDYEPSPPQRPKKPKEPVKAWGTFILKDDEQWPLSKTQVDKYEKLYSHLIDVQFELGKAQQWCEANPSKRKTARGMPRCLNSWLSREATKAQERRDEHPQDDGDELRDLMAE